MPLLSARSLAASLPDPVLHRLITGVSQFPPRLAAGPERVHLLDGAERLEFDRGFGGWAFGTGPLVVLVHGWAGGALQMATLAQVLAGRGMRAVIFDVAGHGQRRRTGVTFSDFGADLARCVDALGPPTALVGHSAGALCMMAARRTHGLQADHYVCLAAPRGPYPPIDDVRRLVGDRPGVLDRCRNWWAGQLGMEWEALDQGAAYSCDGEGSLLVVGDADDTIVDPADVDVITAEWPDAQIMRTSGLGHRRILWDPSVAHAVAAFLTHDVAA